MYLNCKTFFSYRYGTFTTEKLVLEGVEQGASVMALTNINNTSDWWDFYTACLERNIRPVLGVEIRNEDELLYLLLAKNNAGLLEINRFLSHHLQQKEDFPPRHPFTENVWIILPLDRIREDLRANEMIGVKPSEVNRLFTLNTSAIRDRLVVRQPVTYAGKQGFNLHRLLRAVDKNIVLSKQEGSETASADEYFIAPAQVISAFRQYPFIITNALQLADSCSYVMELHTDKNKKLFSSSPADDRMLLEKLAMDGLKHRYGSRNAQALERVEKELGIIHNLGFNSYFLITWDVIRYAQSRGFYYVGRGSGANSIVAYCLQITDVNPIDLDLYFERFLNPYRTTPPDFDIDFSWQDRDEVIDYIFRRYGKEHVALLGMQTTFQHSAIIRELAKVFGLPKDEVDALLANPHATMKEDRYQRYIKHYGSLLVDFPNHLSIHPGGMLISEEPICQYTAVDLPPKGFRTTQIDMFVAEKLGLFKLDILSQRGLGHIRETIRLVQENRNVSIDIRAVEKFKQDPLVAAQIRKADTIGCFYIESPAMRQLLLKLKCSDYITLVAASSIIRPGVAQSGMMRQYIHRFHHPGDFEYLHPKMKELLEETYGVMVYQEDVIKIAHHFAGLDLGEADVLRRAMSGKYRGRKEFDRIRDKFFDNCRERGYADELSKEVWRQIESFGGYSFSKAHSASFAVESYQSLYLKTYFPMEFMVAVINNFGGFYSTELYFHELRRAGATVHAPCVNRSSELTNISGSDVFVGLVHIKELETQMRGRILDARASGGPFLHLQDFMERTAIGQEQANTLIRTGALRFTGKNKKELLWEANFLQKKVKESAGSSAGLFPSRPLEFRLPELVQLPIEDALDEIEILGFPLCDPFSIVDIERSDHTTARELAGLLGKQVELLGYFITQKPVRTIKGEVMQFGTFLDRNGDWMDTVHFAEVTRRTPLTGRGFYEMKGKVVEDFGVFSVEVHQVRKAGWKRV
jgi:DNA-directed DNA polymerase III PolC